ncbi:hypothetical protein B296_00027313, partial [Ensete ventricosum]
AHDGPGHVVGEGTRQVCREEGVLRADPVRPCGRCGRSAQHATPAQPQSFRLVF